MPVERVAFRGSERQQIPESQQEGAPDPNALISVTVLLRSRTAKLPEVGSKTFTRE